MINKKLIVLTALVATGCLRGMESDAAFKRTVKTIIEYNTYEGMLRSTGSVAMLAGMNENLTRMTYVLIAHVVENPDSITQALDACRAKTSEPFHERVESMVAWHLADNQTVPVANRIPALLQLLRTKQAAGKLQHPHLQLDIFEESRSPGSRALSFTDYLRQKVALTLFPDLAMFIAEYEAQRDAYRDRTMAEFTQAQLELTGSYTK